MDTNPNTHAPSDLPDGDDNTTAWTLLRAIAAGLALALIAAVTFIGASPASAATPTTDGFRAPIVPVGGATDAGVYCKDDTGGDAVMYVSHNGGPVNGHTRPITGSLGHFVLRASTDPLDRIIDTTLTGTWSVEIICPSYSPVTIQLQVSPAKLDLVPRVDLDSNCDSGEDPAGVRVGTGIFVCFGVTNTTGVDIRHLVIDLHGESRSFNYGAGEFPDGGSISEGIDQSYFINPAGQTFTGLSAWAELGTPGSGDYVTSELTSAVVPASPPAIVLNTTVAQLESDACATEGGTDLLTIVPGETAWVCYEVTNQSKFTFDMHHLSAPGVGTILAGDTTPLAPNTSRKVKLHLSPAGGLDLTATWTATYTTWNQTFEATDDASINVDEDASPVDPDEEETPEETTTTTAPMDGDLDPTQDDRGTTTTSTAPPSTTSTTESTHVEVLAISAQPKYAG